MATTESEGSTGRQSRRRTWSRLARLGAPYWGRFLLVALFAALSAGAGLLEPLVYRTAVNDVAGVFVNRAAMKAESQAASPRTESKPNAPKPKPHPAPHGLRRIAEPRRPSTPHATRPHRPKPKRQQHHHRGKVAPRTVADMFTTLLWAVGLLFLTGLAAQLFEVLADNTAAATANRIEEDFIRSTFRHVLGLRLGFFGRRASSALARQIDQSDQVAPIVTSFAKDILPEIFRVVGTFAIMFTQSPQLTAVALGTLPAYFFVARRSARNLEATLPRYYSLWEEVSARIRDAVGAIKTVKLSGAEAREVERLQAASHEAYATYLQRNRLANRYVFWQSLLHQLGEALVLGYGGWRVLAHQLTPGDVVMFVTYLDRLYGPIDSLTSLAKTLQEHAMSLERGFRLLEASDTEPRGVALVPGPGRVEFRDVRFSYVPDRPVLHGVTFTLEPGTVTALVGPSGAGKTTIADLLLRLHEPDGGAIFVDGQPLARLDPASVRQAVSVVSADGAVFRGTLAENIRYKRPEATDAEIEAAALAAGLGRTLDRLPDRLATEIGEGGIGLAVGERQRVQLARAFASRPRILVLDEATANLDYATENEIRDALAAMQDGRTTLVIAHRYSMVRDADRVLVLEGGRITQQGTPDELIAAGGWFARFAADASQVGATGSVDDAGDDDEDDEE